MKERRKKDGSESDAENDVKEAENGIGRREPGGDWTGLGGKAGEEEDVC